MHNVCRRSYFVFIGCKHLEEQTLLSSPLGKKQAEFAAIYGRRRVGKTFLIKNTFEKELIFQITGINDVGLKSS